MQWLDRFSTIGSLYGTVCHQTRLFVWFDSGSGHDDNVVAIQSIGLLWQQESRISAAAI